MKIWKYFFGLLTLTAVTIWIAFFSYPKENLSLIACDVGQGDAILVQEGSNQLLVDGGKGSKVLDCLSRHLPFWDREIELIVITHPQLDHYGGLIEVFRRYSVNTLLANSLDSASAEYQELKKAVEESGAKIINPDEDVRLRVGEIYLDVVYPTENFMSENLAGYSGSDENNVLGAYTTKKDPNDFSIVARLRFSEFDALLTGDIGPNVADEVVKQLALSGVERVEYLKIPHHGSKNGLTQELLDASTPEVGVISVGKNPWGHPHQEILKMLREKSVETFRTDELGDVVVETDGESWWLDKDLNR